jgi:hypothetical protein
MRMALGTIVGFFLGGFLGYMLGIYVACEIFEAGNLCGLVGVFITGPLGALGGSIAGVAAPTENRAGGAVNGTRLTERRTVC